MAMMIKIDCYSKSDLSSLNVSDIDSFINFYKTFDYVKGIYENGQNTVADFVAFTAGDMKNTALKSGKRQDISIKTTDSAGNASGSTSEFIYLETAKYYLALSYGLPDVNLTDGVKNAVNDLIFHIEENQGNQ